MITLNDILQLLSILIALIAMCFVGYKMGDMKFSLFRIFINSLQYIFYGLVYRKWIGKFKEPVRWLGDNLIYLGYAILFIGEMSLFFGLLTQVRLHQVEVKSIYFLVGGPLVTIAFFFIIYCYELKVSGRFGTAKLHKQAR